MTHLLTAAEMRALEARAIASGKVTGLELMERAGAGVVEAILTEWPELQTPARAIILCGPGNNGGDGFVVARLLKERGWDVSVFLYGHPERLPPDAKTNYDRWRELGAVLPISAAPANSYEYQVIVDALFGIGLSRPLSDQDGLTAVLPVEGPHAPPPTPRVVAVDLPSGLCSDSGRPLGKPVFWADLTVTFHAAKVGHYLADGSYYSGRLRIVDIGLERIFADTYFEALQAESEKSGRGPGWVLHRPSAEPQTTTYPPAKDPASLVGRPYTNLGKVDRFDGDTHKYSYGHALILCGGPGQGGAARLAARAALRVGAGLVTIGCPSEALPENAARLDAIMLRPIDTRDTLSEALSDKRLNALCLGPGHGVTERTRSFVLAALGAETRPQGGLGTGAALTTLPSAQTPPAVQAVVLDADAITVFKNDPETLFAAIKTHSGSRTILTPHSGEFARLFPDLAEALNAPTETGPAFSKLDAAREASERAGATILLKGPATVIADPSGQAAIHAALYNRAAPWLATAGSGDVLAGLITGLLARGHAPFTAASTAAWLHVEAARTFGPGLIAEDLPETLPKVLNALTTRP